MILGVDPGLAHTGWALLERGVLVAHGIVITTRKRGVGDLQRRLAEIGAGLHPQIHRSRHVVCEFPGGGFGRNAGAAAQVAAVAGVVIGQAWGSGRKVAAPAPVTWRAELGHARGADEALHAELLDRYPAIAALLLGHRPHVLDAIGLALYGERIANPQRHGDQDR